MLTEVPIQQSVRPLTKKDIFWSVFLALWAFGISAGVIVAVIRVIMIYVFWVDIPK